MAHPEAYDLSDAEKHDLIVLIRAGKTLPEKYRFLLFEERWTGGYIFENEWQSFRRNYPAFLTHYFDRPLNRSAS